jgi:hypothetical protein
MPYIREKQFRDWDKKLKYLEQFEVLRPDQQDQFNYLTEILEAWRRSNECGNPDHGTTGEWQVYVG